MMSSQLWFVIEFLALIGYCRSIDVTLMDNCMPQTNVLDLNSFINPSGGQSTMTYTLTKVYKASDYFEIRKDTIFTKTTLNMNQLCSAINECCNKEVDYCVLKIKIMYFNNQNQKSNMRDVIIQIKDNNDQSPKFDKSYLEIFLSESKIDPYVIILPLAKDSDFGKNRIQNYLIESKEPSLFDSYFHLVVNRDKSVPSQVGLKLNRNLDRETIKTFSFELVAIDGGIPDRKTGSISIKIVVVDENDNSPIFNQKLYHETIKEGVFNSRPIVVLSASDIDEGENAKIIYNFSPSFINDNKINDYFKISPDGNIYLKKALDYEKERFYTFSVTATNPTPFSKNTLVQSSAVVEIVVENVDDEPLQIIVDYPNGRNWSQVDENTSGSFVAVITTMSMESGGKTTGIVCNLRSNEKIFELIPQNNDDSNTKSFEVRTLIGIDREVNPRIETSILCKDVNSISSKYSEAKMVVVVSDENDNAPQLTIDGETIVTENEVIGKVIFTVKANDPDDGENGRVSFSMEKSNVISLDYLKIGETDGKVRVKNTIDCEASTTPLLFFDVIITGTDHGRPSKSTDITLRIRVRDVNDNVPTFITNPLQFSIVENSPEFSLIGEIEIQDKDYGDKIALKIVNNNQLVLPFTITTRDNKIFYLNSTKSIDREKDAMFKFKIVASDLSRAYDHSVTDTVEVKVLDINDNAPTIIFPMQNNASIHRISYLEPINHKFLHVSANDQDQSPDNSRLDYTIDDPLKIFGITNEETSITTIREMTKADIGEHRITIIVRDCGIPQLESSVTISIVIDQSRPKSLSVNNNARFNTANGDRMLSSSSDVILYITIIVIVLVIIIISVLFVYFLRRCRKENSCFSNAISMYCQCLRPSSFGSKSLMSSQPSKSHCNDENHIYNTNQRPLINNESDHDNVSPNWDQDNSRVSSYNIAINPYLSNKSPYAQLVNHPTSYYPLQMPHIYQTIEDGHPLQRHIDVAMPRIPSYQLRGMNGEQYKSELNLKRWNFMDTDCNDDFQFSNVPAMQWVTSQTPLPTRSRNITNTVIERNYDDENFAVAFPQDQSTFV